MTATARSTLQAATQGPPGLPPAEPPPPDVITQTLPWAPEDCQIITIPLAEPNLRAQCASPATSQCPEGTVGVTAYKYRTRPQNSADPLLAPGGFHEASRAADGGDQSPTDERFAG